MDDLVTCYNSTLLLPDEDLRGGGGKSWGSIKIANAKNITQTHSFLKFLKVYHQVTTISKNEILKHADFASEWRKSRLRGLQNSKILREDATELLF